MSHSERGKGIFLRLLSALALETSNNCILSVYRKASPIARALVGVAGYALAVLLGWADAPRQALIIFLVLPIFYAATIEVRRRSRNLQSQDRSQEE